MAHVPPISLPGSAMPNNTGPRCGVQIARQHRLKKHPGEFGPEQDICDVTVWLRQKYPLSNARLVIYRHYTQHGRQFSHVGVSSACSNTVLLTAQAREAFVALGYSVNDTGGDTYRCPSCNGQHSSHEHLLAYARIERILRHRNKA